MLFGLSGARASRPVDSFNGDGAKGWETASRPDTAEQAGYADGHNGEIAIQLSYRYIFSEQADRDNREKHPQVPIQHYPLIAYDLDYATTPNVKIGNRLPHFLASLAFQYVDSLGNTKMGTVGEFSQGKLLVLDFWATWCGPCIQSMDKWNAIADTLADEVQVLGVMLDHNFRAQYYGRERGWSVPIVFGPESYILNSFFFDRQVISRMAWIKDGRLIAITGTKGYDLQTVKDIVEGMDVEIPMVCEWTYSKQNQ